MLQPTEKLEEIKKNIKNGVVEPSFLDHSALMGGHKFLFSTRQISCQKLLCHIVTTNCLKRFHIVTQSFAASFSTA